MAASTGDEDIKESTSENAPKPPNNLPKQQNVEKTEESSTNSSVSSSSFGGATNKSFLKPSLFSASGSSTPHFGSTSSFGSSSYRSPFSLKPSVFGSFGGSDKDSGTPKRPVILRASQLESVTSSPVSSTVNSTNNSFVLSPPKLNNPFFKAVNEKDDSNSTVSSTSNEEVSGSSKSTTMGNCCSEAPKLSFVPLASSTSGGNSQSVTPATANTSVSSFVFGQNLHERVEVPAEVSHRDVESSDGVASDSNTCDSEVSKTNGTTSEMLFTSVIQRELPDKQSEIGSDEKKRKSLSEAAREYEESRAVKRKYEEVAVKTGEEEEINVLQINCKLFAFNKEKSTWVERGRGTLRLNDLSLENRTQSRVVMRVSGSLRVVLNTKIWAEMAVDRPSEKSVRLTAMDSSGEIKVFLVMAGVKEMDQLFKALEWRVNNQKKLAATGTSDKSSVTSDS